MEGEEPQSVPLRFLPVCEAGGGPGDTFFRNLTLRMLIKDPQVQRYTHTQTKTLYTLTHSPRGGAALGGKALPGCSTHFLH